jgi:NADH dehydrogenase (ubiquinone) 1 alpha/beta subcomplex 1
MFRTAILRSVFRPAAVRAAVPRASPLASRITVAPRQAAWAGAIRSYAASSGLGKQEVEDRIKALLQGFDKVSTVVLCSSRHRRLQAMLESETEQSSDA